MNMKLELAAPTSVIIYFLVPEGKDVEYRQPIAEIM